MMSRVAQTLLAGQMLPAGRVFETPGIDNLQVNRSQIKLRKCAFTKAICETQIVYENTNVNTMQSIMFSLGKFHLKMKTNLSKVKTQTKKVGTVRVHNYSALGVIQIMCDTFWYFLTPPPGNMFIFKITLFIIFIY